MDDGQIGFEILIVIAILFFAVRNAIRAHFWDKAVNKGRNPFKDLFSAYFDFRRGWKQAKREAIEEQKQQTG